MLSDVTICNIALRRLGIRRINSLDDVSPQAELCKQQFENIVKIVLRDHDWGFATKTVEPTVLSGEAIIGWGYLYKRPSDCIKPRRLYTETTFSLPEPEPFREMLSPTTNTKVIVCNLEGATLEYTAYTADTLTYDLAFIDALAWRMAADFAHPLAAKAELGIKFMQIYQQVLENAKWLDENAKQPPKQDEVCDYITDR